MVISFSKPTLTSYCQWRSLSLLKEEFKEWYTRCVFDASFLGQKEPLFLEQTLIFDQCPWKNLCSLPNDVSLCRPFFSCWWFPITSTTGFIHATRQPCGWLVASWVVKWVLDSISYMQLQLEGATLWSFKLESEPKKITAIEEGNLARRPWAISVYIRETSGFHVNVFGKYPRYFFKHRKTPSNAERLEPHFMGDSPEWGKLQNFPQRCGTPSLQGKKKRMGSKKRGFSSRKRPLLHHMQDSREKKTPGW